MPIFLFPRHIRRYTAVLAAYFWRAQSRGEGDVMSYGGAGHLVLIPLALHGYLLDRIFFRGVISTWGY